MRYLDKPFPFFLNNDRGNFALILFITGFTYAFLTLFKPWNADAATIREIPVYCAITLVVLTFNIILLPRLLPRFLDNGNWTLRKYIWFNVYNVVSVSLIISLSHYGTRPITECDPFLWALFVDLYKTFLIGIFPLVGITFMLENRLLAQALEAGNTATSKLQHLKKAQINTQSLAEADRDRSITIRSSETKETVDIDLSTFLFAQAENNYSELFWQDEIGAVSHKLMRLSLKGLEEQIGNGHIMRCHRSFVVNLKKVDSVSGNTNGYRLHMAGAEEGIPVSRTLGKDILERIDEMSAEVA